MSVMFEVYYPQPVDADKETALTARISLLHGHLSYRELPEEGCNGGVCLTYEFDDRSHAEAAAESLRRQGEHVEGPVDYGR